MCQIKDQKKTVLRFFTNVANQTARARSPECRKHKITFKPDGDLADQVFFYLMRLDNNQDPHSQTENDETLGEEYRNENDSEDTETKLL